MNKYSVNFKRALLTITIKVTTMSATDLVQKTDVPNINEKTSTTMSATDLVQKKTDDVPNTNEKTSTTLPAKFFKNLTFGYWMIIKMKNDSLITDSTFDIIMNEYLKVYASIQDQTAYYEAFDTDFKMLSKELKKLIKDFHKPPKLKKLNNNTHHHKSNKRGRPSKKNQLLSTQHDDDLISSIVTAAFDNMNHYTPPLLQRTSS